MDQGTSESAAPVIGHPGRAAEFRRSKASEAEVAELRAEVERMRFLLARPYIGAWTDEVIVEAAHQRGRWGDRHDHGKRPEDWYWLIGHLAGKALRAHIDGDTEKARHHTVSTGAVLAHWAAFVSGRESVFRPGLGPEKLAGVD